MWIDDRGEFRLSRVIRRDATWVLLIACAPAPFALLFPQIRDVIEIGFVLCVPLMAALVRADLALGELRSTGSGRPTLPRQLGLAFAIVLLFVFEILAGALACDPRGAPAEVRAIAGGLLLAYLVAIAAVMRPAPAPEPGEGEWPR